MIYGVGTDIVRIDRMVENLEKYGEKFAQRILSDAELDDYRASIKPSNFLAKRFAAKEATVKALGTGFRDGISMRHITVTHDDLGRPILLTQGRLRDIIEEKGVEEAYLSLADEEEYAIAYVTFCLAAKNMK